MGVSISNSTIFVVVVVVIVVVVVVVVVVVEPIESHVQAVGHRRGRLHCAAAAAVVVVVTRRSGSASPLDHQIELGVLALGEYLVGLVERDVVVGEIVDLEHDVAAAQCGLARRHAALDDLLDVVAAAEHHAERLLLLLLGQRELERLQRRHVHRRAAHESDRVGDARLALVVCRRRRRRRRR